jgi:hypothetical protein
MQVEACFHDTARRTHLACYRSLEPRAQNAIAARTSTLLPARGRLRPPRPDSRSSSATTPEHSFLRVQSCFASVAMRPWRRETEVVLYAHGVRCSMKQIARTGALESRPTRPHCSQKDCPPFTKVRRPGHVQEGLRGRNVVMSRPSGTHCFESDAEGNGRREAGVDWTAHVSSLVCGLSCAGTSFGLRWSRCGNPRSQ